MSRQRLRKARFITCVGAVFMTAVACSGGGQRPLGVSVKDVTTDVGLGIDDPGFDTAPANTLVRRPVPAALVPRKASDFQAPVEVAPPVPPVELFQCKDAGPFDFPKVQAPIAVTGQRPTEGSYQWFAEGKVKTTDGTVEFEFPEPRLIFNVGEDPFVEGAFGFDMLQLVLLGEPGRPNSIGAQITTFYVITQNPSDAQGVDRDEGEGIYLQRIISAGTDENGEPTFTTFSPKPLMLLVPFPIQPGLQIDSTGVDMHGAETPVPGGPVPTPNPADDRVLKLTIRGEIKGKDQVDACGERVDSWLFEGEREYSVTNPTAAETVTTLSKYDFNIATQFGGMMVREHIQVPKDGPILDLNSRLGRLTPTTFESDG